MEESEITDYLRSFLSNHDCWHSKYANEKVNQGLGSVQCEASDYEYWGLIVNPG